MGTPKKGQGGRADPPRGEKTSLAKVVGGERGKIGQTKISSKREKEREQLMEPEETVTALKIRERVRSKKEGEEDRSGKDRRVEVEIREEGGSGTEESAGGQTQSRAMEKGMCNVTKRGRSRFTLFIRIDAVLGLHGKRRWYHHSVFYETHLL